MRRAIYLGIVPLLACASPAEAPADPPSTTFHNRVGELRRLGFTFGSGAPFGALVPGATEGISAHGDDLDLDDVRSEDEAVLGVSSFRVQPAQPSFVPGFEGFVMKASLQIAVEARAIGTTRLVVSRRGAVVDRVAIEVAPPAHVGVRCDPIGPELTVNDVCTVKWVARDADGRQLGGMGWLGLRIDDPRIASFFTHGEHLDRVEPAPPHTLQVHARTRGRTELVATWRGAEWSVPLVVTRE